MRRSSFLVKSAGNVITHKRKTHLRWLSPAMHACFSAVLNLSVRRASGGGPWRSCRQLVPRGTECDFGRGWLPSGLRSFEGSCHLESSCNPQFGEAQCALGHPLLHCMTLGGQQDGVIMLTPWCFFKSLQMSDCL